MTSDEPIPTPADELDDAKTDKAMEDTFPASDPPSTGGSTGPNDNNRAGSQNK